MKYVVMGTNTVTICYATLIGRSQEFSVYNNKLNNKWTIKMEDEQDDNNIDEGDEDEEEEEEEEGRDSESEKLYQQLLQSYQRVTAQLQYEDGMEEVLHDYNKLFDTAKAWRVRGDELEDKVNVLLSELSNVNHKYSECKEFALSQREEYQELKKELEEAQRLADSARARELNATDVISGLRAELSRMSKELAARVRAAAASEDLLDPQALVRPGRGPEGPHERLASELASTRERLERSLSQARELERTSATRERLIDELARKLEAQEVETAREVHLKQLCEAELDDMRTEINRRDKNFSEMEDRLDAVTRDYKVLLEDHKQVKTMAERLQREHELISSRNHRLQQELTASEKASTDLRADLEQRAADVESLEHRVQLLRKEVARTQRERAMAARKAAAAETARTDAHEEIDRLLNTVVKGLEDELKVTKEKAGTDVRALQRLARERELLDKALQRCREMDMEYKRMGRLQEQARRALAEELEEQGAEVRGQRRQLRELQRERDHLLKRADELQGKAEKTLEEVRLQQTLVHEGDRHLVQGEAQLRHQRSLYETVRAERNAFAQHLLEAQEEISDLRQKLKVQGHLLEQMKEDITSKEMELRRAMKAAESTDKEKEELRLDLQVARDEVTQARSAVASAAAEERRLLAALAHADKEQRQVLHEAEQTLKERDALAAQLVLRDRELSLLYEKIHLLEVTLKRGEAHYARRLEDVRLLGVEVRRLRNEKRHLQRSLDNMAKLRTEVFHLERDLTRERQKTRALEEELQNPLNVHRWRKLRGTDPTTFDLVEKVQLLQRRLLAQAADAMEREAQMQQMQKLYGALRQMLQRRPGPDATDQLFRTRLALRERGRKLKVLAAEANMFEAQVSEFKVALERAQKEAVELKMKSIEQKKRERRLRDAVRMGTAGNCIAAPPVRRFMGGGFSMVPKTPA